MPQFDGTPFTQLTTPARADVQGVIKDISEALPENQTKYAELQDLLKFGAWASKLLAVTASGSVTLTNTDPAFVEIDPNGSNRDVNFPAKSDDNHGYFVHHVGSANTLTLKRSGGATITTLAAGELKYIKPSTTHDFSAQTSGGTSTLVQRVEGTPNTTYSSITTAIPVDDTVPQNTEGGEVCTVTITPTNASNRLVIRAQFFGASDTALATVLALFQGSTANALAARSHQAGSANALFALDIEHEMEAGTTSAITFKLRAGNNGGATTYVNGTSAGRRFGGVTACRISVEEIKV